MELEDKIKALIDSDISAYAIGKGAGIPDNTIKRIRQGKSTIDGVTLGTARKLASFYDSEFEKTLD